MVIATGEGLFITVLFLIVYVNNYGQSPIWKEFCIKYRVGMTPELNIKQTYVLQFNLRLHIMNFKLLYMSRVGYSVAHFWTGFKFLKKNWLKLFVDYNMIDTVPAAGN